MFLLERMVQSIEALPEDQKSLAKVLQAGGLKSGKQQFSVKQQFSPCSRLLWLGSGLRCRSLKTLVVKGFSSSSQYYSENQGSPL